VHSVAKSYFGEPASVVEAELAAAEYVECPVCRIPPKPFARDYQGFQLCCCGSCGLQFLNPRPTFSQLSEKVYNDSYWPEIDSPPQPTEAQAIQFEAHLAGYERLRGRSATHTRKILDVGCGKGLFLRHAQNEGWDIFGTDISLTPAVKRLMCPLWQGRINEINFGKERFDVVRINHVLEHTQNPLEELSRIREVLAPGGMIHISVPNLGGLSPLVKGLQSRLGLKRHRWRHYACVHHLFFFTPKTLRSVVEAAGLRVVTWETPFLRRSFEDTRAQKVYRWALERSRTASILDFYCTSG